MARIYIPAKNSENQLMKATTQKKVERKIRDIYSGHSPPLGGDFSKVKNREEFEGGLEKRKGKGGKRRKKKKSDKTHVKIPL